MTAPVAGVPAALAANILWFLPTHGDGRYLGAAEGARETSLPYLRQIAQAVDDLGYFGALLPTGRSCDDSWVVASALAPMTERMRFLVAVRPGLQSPAMAARMAATLDRISGGRLLINVVAGGDPVELKGDGIFLDHSARYDVTAEFLDVWRRMMRGETVTHRGRHLQLEDARLFYPAVQRPYPPLYFGGSSDAGMEAAADHIDLYLTWGEPPADVAQKLARMKALADARGRTVRFGIRLHTIVRDTAAEAWKAADELISRLDDATIAKAQAVFARMDSVGQQRMTRLHAGSRGQLEISPNLWAGVGLARGGAGTALVGDPDTVALRMKEYMAVGVDTFILSGYPHLEEAYRFAELVFPRLPLAAETGRPAAAVANEGPFGERVANHLPPVPRVAAH